MDVERKRQYTEHPHTELMWRCKRSMLLTGVAVHSILTTSRLHEFKSCMEEFVAKNSSTVRVNEVDYRLFGEEIYKGSIHMP